ncbi:MAG: GIY-YIG nuclease family protein [Ectothiorhodospiraceae bacterium]|nr:GIY-YIG nuclease family protein [Ectothiorhodospiraceae bacterium]
MPESKNKTPEWYVYIILCSDTSLYTGISTDTTRRFEEHRTQKGAKYFRARAPEKIVFIEGGHTRSTASQREAAVKKLSRQEKLSLINAYIPLGS